MGQVSKGDRIRASDINRVLKIADAEVSGSAGLNVSRVSGAGTSLTLPSSLPGGQSGIVVSAINSTGGDRERGDSGCIVGQGASDPRVERRVLLEVGPFTDGDSLSFLGIFASPVKSGNVGRVYVDGICLAKVSGSGSWGYATAGSHVLTLGASGIVQVLWSSGGVGLVRFSGSGSGGGTTLAQWQFVWNEGV